MSDIEERINSEVEKRLRDPVFLQSKLAALLTRNRDLKDKNERVFGSDRDYSMARVAEHLQIEYFDPSGELRVMGQNILHMLFVHDGLVVKRGAEGYRLSKRYEKYGQTVSAYYQTKNGETRVRDSAQFSGRGLEYLIERYRKDTRIFRVERFAGYARFVAE